MSADDRHSIAGQAELIDDPDLLARQEVENGLHQYRMAMEIVRNHVNDPERPFQLRPSQLLRLNYEALKGIHRQAGLFRNTAVQISKSSHHPPDHLMVPEEVERLCDYVNENWATGTAVHLCAYLLWRLNWVHPFADGNGRTSRTVAYMVLNIKLNSMLPGSPTIPEQISSNKNPYYAALEMADEAWRVTQSIDVSAMENLVETTLARQLVSAARDAAGRQETASR